MQSLNQKALPAMAARGIPVPSYPRIEQQPGVMHFGLGAFHRAHQAIVFGELMEQGQAQWGILGIGMHSAKVADALAAQQGLYSVQVNSHAGRSCEVVGSILQTCVAAREPEHVVRSMALPTTRWVTLTVTEKAYGPELADLLVKGLAARRDAGLGGLTIASCDNLTDNGRKLQSLCNSRAQLQDAALANWISEECAFPNSMVDRIVPAATAQHRQDAAQALGVDDAGALGTEAFWEWVIEDNFVNAADGTALASVGVSVVKDVLPFEQAKLCMLNGSHTAIAVMGAVMGLSTVAECMAQPDLRWFIHHLMTSVMMPQLTRPGLPAYRDALLARFDNIDLHHKVHQIASDSSMKIPLRWVSTVQARLQAHQSVEPLAFAAAVWMRYLLGEDDQNQSYAISDPMADELRKLANEYRGDAVRTVQALTALPTIWGTHLANNPDWMQRVGFWLSRIQMTSVAAALHEFRGLEEHGCLSENRV